MRHRVHGGRIGWVTAFAGPVLGLCLIAAVMPAGADVGPPPPIPHEFSGIITVDGLPTEEGTPVEAFVDDELCASTAVDDQSRYVLLVSCPGIHAGTTVTFRVGGVQANEAATWREGVIDEDFSLTVGAPPPVLTISSTIGGSVTKPGEGEFTYFKGTTVELVATPDSGYQFVSWTGHVGTVADTDAPSTSIAMQGNYSITANFAEAPSPGPDPSPDPDPSPFPFPLPCFIATAAYGTPTAEQIGVLREFRDVVLLQSPPGSRFVALYYQLSPPVAQVMAGSSFLTALLRDFLVDPAVRLVEYTGGIWRP